MPSSLENGEARVKALQAYLAAVFPTAVTRLVMQGSRSPITLLVTSHAVYGFAVCDSNMRRDYEAAYAIFKTLVVAGTDLRSLEPAFIFCIAFGAEDVEQFISSVETDVYFCRKFVIGLSDSIGSSLAPLPFMPLAPIDGAALRPASAQTFLQHSDVPPLLAKQLVVPHVRSAKGIIDDCLAGKHGKPARLKAESHKGMHEVAPSDSEVFLERVTIRNIRAYRKEQEFKLGQSITVLYGPNGFGKTSFFDAIDFGVTGAIGRLPQTSDAHFRKTVRHLDSQGEDAFVNVVFNCNGERNTITRNVASPMSAQLNGAAAERKDILSALTNTSSQASERVDNYISLFRATHLFSQEQQELTKDFRADCELSTAVVSRMLAVEDYVSAKAKADEVQELLTAAIAECGEDIATLQNDIAENTQQLQSLKAMVAELPSPAAIQAAIADIAMRMKDEGLSSGNEADDVNALRGQRALVEGTIGQNQQALELLGSLIERVSELPELVSTQRSVEQQLAAKQLQLEGSQERVALASQMFDASRQSLAVAERQVAQARKAVEDHTWFSASLPIYRDTDQAAREAEDKLNRELATLGAAQAEESRVNERIRGLESEAGSIAELLNMKQAQHSRLDSLVTVLPVQTRKSARIRDIAVEEQRFQDVLNRQSQDLTLAQSELAAQVARADGLTTKMTRLSADQKRLVGLLEEVEGHIEDGICPVCGDDHGSREALIHKIELRRAIDRSADMGNELSECRAVIKRLRDRLNEIESRRSSSASQLRTLAEERERLEGELQSYVVRANEFALDPLSTFGAESARRLLDRTAEETRELRARLDAVTHAANEAQGMRVRAAAAVKDRQGAVTSRREAKAAAEAVIGRLREDQRWNQALAAGADTSLERELAGRAAQLETATGVLSQRRQARDKIQVELEGLRREAANANADIARLRTQLGNVNRKLVALYGSLASAELANDTDSAALTIAIDARQSSLRRLQILRDALIRAELALDAATTAASHVALQSAIREKETRKKEAAARRRLYQPWLAFFKDICRLLQAQQAEAIGNFTNQYGPRTSIIQRRLRSVYSFDDIEIKEQARSIIVRVRRGKENLRPVDYFSQSQQQTLLLGLFLTACSSQTWSSLSSVFLDDPVTHFDDLNAYSLLDLISGLLNTDSRRRQFVISTCDDKFLQLALRKFRYLGLAARFYRFEAIGRDGPIVTEITGRLGGAQPKLAV